LVVKNPLWVEAVVDVDVDLDDDLVVDTLSMIFLLSFIL
jgi:hypothetical protein